MIILNTVIGLSTIAIVVIATYIIGLITRRITEAKAASSREWETTMIAGLIGWMVIGLAWCLLCVATLMGQLVMHVLVN